MRIISIVAGKGGVGKSTVSLLLAWGFSEKEKNKVAIVDTDVQGTCVSAMEMNKSLPFEVISCSNSDELYEAVAKLQDEDFEIVIIDTSPRSQHEDPKMLNMIAELSDLALVPCRPAPRDIKGQVITIESLKKINENKDDNEEKLVIKLLWNLVQKNTGAHSSSMRDGEKVLGLKGLKTLISNRVAYQDVGFSEEHIDKLANPKASLEVRQLIKEVKEIIK